MAYKIPASFKVREAWCNEYHGYFMVHSGTLYRKWFEHCDHQGEDKVREALCWVVYQMRELMAIVTSEVYKDSGSADYGFDVWVAVDATKEYIKEMKLKGFNKPDPPLNPPNGYIDWK